MDDKLKKTLDDVKSDLTKNARRNQFDDHVVQFSGVIQKRWGRLTDDDMKQVRVRHDILEGRLQGQYGEARKEVKREIDDWANELKF